MKRKEFVPDSGFLSCRNTLISEKIVLVKFLCFFVFSLRHKIRNDKCCHFKCIAGTPY